MTVWEPKEKKPWLLTPSWFNPPFWSLEKKLFYAIFFKIKCSFQIPISNWFAKKLFELWKIHDDFVRHFVFFCSNLFSSSKFILFYDSRLTVEIIMIFVRIVALLWYVRSTRLLHPKFFSTLNVVNR
jgi:hypothetical protein